ncbi:MAG TPA: hypothetical protein VM282_22415 [Acidimicrobiales bacterium]|nr:hypothetical protein [Acidimicrobiales bacterium]
MTCAIVEDERLDATARELLDGECWSVVYVRDITEHHTTDANRQALSGWFDEGPTWDGSPYPSGTTWLSPDWYTTWLSPDWYHDPAPSPVKRRWLRRFDDLGVKPTVSDPV